MIMIYYICTYEDYTELPSVLFQGATQSEERKSLNGSKFVVWSIGGISWLNGAEPTYTHSETLAELQKPEWIEAEI
jgi:hypothetical protein